MNAWHARSVAKQQKAATTHANLAANVRSVVNVESAAKAKAVASAAHAVNATKVAANVPHAWTKTAIQKHCLWTTRLAQRAKRRRPTKTVANVVSVAHAIATAVTAASVATAHRVKKVLQSMATTNKPRKTLATRVSHANRVNPESLASHVSAKSAVTVRHCVRMRRQQRQ